MNLFSLFSPYTKYLRHIPPLTSVVLCLTTTPLVASGENDFEHLPGWQEDDLSLAWNGWQQSCVAFNKKKLPRWIELCHASTKIDAGNSVEIRSFFESAFKPLAITNEDGSTEGVITGYYEPVLSARQTPNEEYRYPIYAKPKSIQLQSLSRQQINKNPQALKPHILLWTNNRFDLFFLHVQGSGRVRLADGHYKSLVYAGNNGHEYTSIGKVLIDRGLMQKEKISMQSLKQWLSDNPQQATEIMHQNKRYIFFELQDLPRNESGPRGSLNVPLTPGRSIAIDPDKVMLGSPIWLDTTLPSSDQAAIFRRLVFAQDTGAAIKGKVRADVFFGQGEQAEYLAGHMNQTGRMFLLVPRQKMQD